MNNQISNDAVGYSRLGWAVLPVHGVQANGTCTCNNPKCNHIGKHPNTRNGSKDATKDESAICRFCQFTNTNIGVATGGISGICVVDIDPRHGGDESLRELEKQHGPLPKTVTAQTGSEGGLHYFFKCPPDGIKNRADMLPGIDVRGDGGYVVAPPSLHLSGRRYTWKETCGPNETPLAEIPPWLLNLIKSKAEKKSQKTDEWSEGTRNSSLFKLAGSLRNQGHAVEDIEALLIVENQARCIPPLPEEEVKKIAASVGRYQRGKVQSIKWSERTTLPSSEVEVPVLTEEMIPPAFRAWVLDVSLRMQSSVEMLMAPTIVVLSAIIGRRLTIKPKQKDDWRVFPNLWGGVIAPPSAMKTPAMSEVLKPLRRLEEQSKQIFEEEQRAYQQELKEVSEDEEPPTPPVRRRRLTNDATIEKIGLLLSENPNGLIVFRDELYGFLKNLEKQGHEADRQFYLESFNGDGSYVFDRIQRGTIDVPALCLSIMGGIQPDRLGSYFNEVIKNGSGDDGFLSRFQVLVYPPRRKKWELVDQYPNEEAKQRAYAMFNTLDDYDFRSYGLEQDEHDGIPSVRFDAEAQSLFNEWLTTLEQRLRSDEIDSPAFEAHLAKYRKLMPSLALIFHAIDVCDSQTQGIHPAKVSLQSARMAAAWCDFLEQHAKKIYADALRPQVTAAHVLTKRIASKDITDGMTVRTVYRKEWSQLRDAKIVRLGLGVLESCNWIKIVEESTTGVGALKEIIRLHPELRDGNDE